jgi:Nuclease-related domain
VQAPNATNPHPGPGDPCPSCESPLRLTTYKHGPKSGRPVIICSDYSCPTFIDVEEGDVTPRRPVPGESAQAHFEQERTARNERVRRATPFLAGVGILGSGTGYWVVGLFSAWPWPGVAAVLLTAFFIWYIARLTPEVIDWKHGAEAERRVGASLDALEPLGFVTLYDRRLVGRGGNIDALTVGPPGVFVVETKWRRRGVDVINGRLEVGGREQPDVVKQVTDLAMLVQVSLADMMNRHRLTVVPIICIGNHSVDAGSRSGGVAIVGAKSIASHLKAMPEALSDAEVQELAVRLDYALPAFERRA